MKKVLILLFDMSFGTLMKVLQTGSDTRLAFIIFGTALSQLHRLDWL